MQISAELPLFLVVICASGAAAVTDLRSGIVPNALIVAMLMGGLLLHVGDVLVRGSQHLQGAAAFTVLGLVVCSIAPAILYKLKGLGGGDLKLLAALGVCMGPGLGFQVQAYAFTLATLYAFGRAAYEGTFLRTLFDGAGFMASALLPGGTALAKAPVARAELRFAPAIFGGVLITAGTRLALS